MSVAEGGTDYEKQLLTLFALGGIQNYKHKHWKLSNENKAAGKFDDLIFQLDADDLLVQAKHKSNKNLQEHQFLSSNPNNNKDKFSLAKYILSYKTVTAFNPKYLIICGNSDVDMKLLIEKPIRDYEIIEKVFEKCKVYSINVSDYFNQIETQILDYQNNLKSNNEWKKLVVTRQEIEDFLNKFLYIRAKDGDIENTIRNKLQGIQKHTIFTISSYKYVLDRMQDWYRTNKAAMTNIDIKSILYGEKNKLSIESVLNENILFKNYYQIETFNCIHIKPGKIYELYLKKVLQGLWMSYNKEGKPKDMFFNEVLLLDATDNVRLCEEIIECFDVIKLKFLIIVILQDSVKLLQAVNNIETKIKGSNKKVIILSDKIYFNGNYKLINERITFSNFSTEAQNLFKQKQLVFQGEKFCLNQITVNIDFNDLFDEYAIEKFLISQVISIGLKIKKLEDKKNYYIPRNLMMINNSFNEDKILNICKQPTLVISDQPGTGKSTLLLKLVNDWKEKFPDHWILNLDLGITIQYLKGNEMRANLLNLLNLHENCTNHFEKKLMSSLKKIILLDGVDEINEIDRNLIFSFFTEIGEFYEIVKIIITTRSYSFILDELKSYDKLDITTLEEFSSRDQILFFQKYFKYKSNIIVSNAEEFINQCPIVFKHFLNIPLYTEMIADIFSDQIIAKTTTKNSIISVTNTYELFKLFIDKKKEIFLKNKCCQSDLMLSNILSDSFDRYLEDLEILAIRKNFGDSLIKNLLDTDPDRKIKKSVLHVGIIVVDKDVRFIHKTFEEYFVAINIWNKLSKKYVSNKLLEKVCLEVFLNMEKVNICHFIDCILETKSAGYLQHLTNIYGKLLSRIEFYSHKGISILASHGSVNILRLLFDKCEHFSTIINLKGKYGESLLLLSAHHLPTVKYLVKKGADVLSTDSNGFTALHYAVTQFSSFENFELQLAALSKSLLYKEMMFHMNSVQSNLYKYNEINNYLKRPSTERQSRLILQHQADDFKSIVDYFKNQNLNLNNQTKIGSTILHYIAYCGLFKEFKYLVDEEANFLTRDFYGNSVMHYAVLGGSLEIIQYLFSKNIDLNHPNINGVAPIHFTPISNSLHVLLFLVKNGVDIETEDLYGRTVLFYINSATSMKMLKLIIDLGISITRKSKTDMNYTALHMASYTNALEIVKYLINNCNLQPVGDRSGQFPVHYAAEGDAVKVLKYFHNSIQPISDIVDLDGASVLHLAAIGDSINAVQYLVEQVGMNPTIADFYGKIPLHYAAGGGSLKVCKYFISQGVDVNITDYKNATVLHYAAGNRSLDFLKYMLEKINMNTDAVDDTGKHAIHYAAESGFLSGIKYFIDFGINVGITDSIGNNILHYSSLGNTARTTKYIYEHFPVLNKANKEGQFPIHCAVRNDSSESLKYFVQQGFDVNIVLNDKITLLHLAAGENAIENVKYLIECSIKIKEDGNKRLPCHYAAEGDAVEVLQYFVNIGLSMDVVDQYGFTVVHCAASNNATQALIFFIKILNMPFNKCDYSGKLPLHHAALNNSMDSIKYLLSIDNLMDISVADHIGLTVLHLCGMKDAVDAFKCFIIDYNSKDINTKDILGREPIHVSIQHDAIEVVKFIFTYRYDTSILDEYGNNLLHWALRYDAIKVIRYFIEECCLDFLKSGKNFKKLTPFQVGVKYKSVKAMEYFGLLKKKNKIFRFRPKSK